MDSILQRLVTEFNLKPIHVENTVKLIDDGNTIPFIARYRKELTGEMDDQVLRLLGERLEFLRNLQQKKDDTKRLIDEQGKLTDELIAAIDKAKTLTEVDDIYRPYRPKRRTRATIAKEKGLEPLAELIFLQELKDGNVDEIASEYIDEEKGVATVEEAINGALDIIAETISDNADYRKEIRNITSNKGLIETKAAKKEDSVYSMYYEFIEPLSKVANHRILAIDRGEKEEFLSVKIVIDQEIVLSYIYSQAVKQPSIFTSLIRTAADDAYKRLIAPSIEREIRNEMTETAMEQAIKLFSLNLKNLLLQPPIRDNVVLGVDPGYRTGCKLAVIDPTGRVLDTGIGYFTLEHHDRDKAKVQIKALIKKHGVTLIAIGNGTASKESEIFISEIISEEKRDRGAQIYYIMVNEAGASVYSASKLAAEEFPEFDVALRSAVSIARRIQDPLAELVKIDPKSIGVGQYQHDMNQKKLGEALGGVVEDSVNSVGVDLNTASASLLSYVAGINMPIAKNIIAYREENGLFTSRKQLTKVKGLGPKAYLQCAGFMRIPKAKNPLDNTSVHPESYGAATAVIEKCGYSLKDIGKIGDLRERMKLIDAEPILKEYNIGRPTLLDIVEAILKPGRDPRDELPKPMLMTDVMSMEDLKEGMIMTGTVRNVIDFGAFVDIGVHQDGLVHISQISDKFIKHPTEVLAVGDVVKVQILTVDVKKQRISLTMRGI